MGKLENKSSNKNIIEKANALNTLRNMSVGNGMDLTEFRFFCLYLSKLNARTPNNRTIVIPISEFEELFGVSIHTTRFTNKIQKISSRQMKIKENNKLKIINIYSSFAWIDDKNCKEIEVTCNYDMLPYLFELKENYTTYKIVNIVHLNSVPKIRLYEICKQYQKMKTIKINLGELQEMMCCKVVEFKFFKRDTLDPAVRDINQHTDIEVSYTKNLSCRKVVALTFTILKKEDCVELIPEPEPTEMEINAHRRAAAICNESPLESLYLKCNKEYTLEELFALSDYIGNSGVDLNVSTENYIYSIYRKIQIEEQNVKNLYKYTFAIIEKQINGYIFGKDDKSKNAKKRKRKDTSYDIEEFKNLVEVHEVK